MNSAYININLKPCKSSAECVEYDRQGLLDYLGQPAFVMYQNTQRFDPKVFESSSIVSESFLWSQYVDKRQANWMQIQVQSKEVDDEIKYLHIGDL